MKILYLLSLSDQDRKYLIKTINTFAKQRNVTITSVLYERNKHHPGCHRVRWPTCHALGVLTCQQGHTLHMNDKSHDENFLIKNAIYCWLHHFPNYEWTQRYKELANRDTYTRMDVIEPKPKPRPARRRKATT